MLIFNVGDIIIFQRAVVCFQLFNQGPPIQLITCNLFSFVIYTSYDFTSNGTRILNSSADREMRRKETNIK